MAKKMIIKGVGTMMAKKVSADGKGIEVITLGTLQNLRIDFNVEIDDIFGGDGLFAIDTLIRSKSVQISATDAKFDLDALSLMQGATVQEQTTTSLWVLGEQSVAAAGTIGTNVAVTKVPVSFGKTLFGDGNFAVRLKDSNKLLTAKAFDATTAPAADEFYIEIIPANPTATPPTDQEVNIVLNTSAANADVVFNYQRTEVGVDVIDLITNEVPFPVHVIHHGSFLQKDGTYAGVETELYSCIAQGQFSLDAQRAAASASTIALKVIDPERADKKLGSIKRYTSATRV